MEYCRFQIGCLFGEYDSFKPNIFMQNFIFIDFHIYLTQFLETVLEIELAWASILLKLYASHALKDYSILYNYAHLSMGT